MDDERCWRAVQSRDPRFDGWFCTAVRTTGIYCRPSCPALTPQRRNVVFHPSAAAAQAAGFRACKRCRPDASPGSPEWDVETVAMRALGDPDAFLPTDLGVLAAARALGVDDLLRRAERWAPWRAYAVQHLWGTSDHPVNRMPEEAA